MWDFRLGVSHGPLGQICAALDWIGIDWDNDRAWSFGSPQERVVFRFPDNIDVDRDANRRSQLAAPDLDASFTTYVFFYDPPSLPVKRVDTRRIFLALGSDCAKTTRSASTRTCSG